MYGCEICISTYIMQFELNAWRSRHIATLRSYYEKSRSIKSGQDRGGNMNTLMKYILMVFIDIKEQVIHKILSNVEI